MTPNEVAARLGISPKTLRSWLRRNYPRDGGDKHTEWNVTTEMEAAARAHFGGSARPQSSPPVFRTDVSNGSRSGSDEAYVVDLCDEALGELGLRQHRFAWLLGDPGRNGARARLPVDCYYPQHRIVVEYRERQHDEPTPFFDRRQTVSGVGRGEQRRKYDQLREELIPAHGLRLVVIRPVDLDADSRGRLRRSRGQDLTQIRGLFGA